MELVKFPTINLRPDENCFVLPDPLITPYAVSDKNSVISTDPAAGYFTQRQRFKQDRHIVNAVWFFNDTELAYFRGWYKNVIHQGASSFILNMKVSDSFNDEEVQFLNPYEVQHLDDGWRVTGILLVTEPTTDDVNPSYVLPDPLISPYTYTDQDAKISTGMETGRVRQRQKFTVGRHTVTATWFFSDAQFEEFRSWFINTINQGADEFTLNMRLDIDFCDETVQFLKTFEATHLDDGWLVEGLLLVKQPATLSEDSICFMDVFGNNYESAIETIDEFHKLINETIPISTPW